MLMTLIILFAYRLSFAEEYIVTIEQPRQIQNIIESIIPKGWSIKTIVDVKNPYGWTEIKGLHGITFEISFDASLFNEWVKKQKKRVKLFIPFVRLTFMPSAYNGTEAPESLDHTLQVTGFSTECLGKWNNFSIFADRGFGYRIDNSCYDSFWPFTRNEIRKAFNLEATEIK